MMVVVKRATAVTQPPQDLLQAADLALNKMFLAFTREFVDNDRAPASVDGKLKHILP